MDYIKASKRLLWLAILTCILSVLSIGIGIGLLTKKAAFPYDVGGGVIAGVFGLVLSIFPLCIYRYSVNGEDPSCCALFMAIYYVVGIMAMIISFGLSGMHAIVVCVSDSTETTPVSACDNPQHDTLLTLSVVTLILTVALTVLSVAVFLTCYCNRIQFGVPLYAGESLPDPGIVAERRLRVGQTEQQWLEDRRNERLERERQEENRAGTLDETETNTESGAPSFVDSSSAQPSAPPVEPNRLANLPPTYEEVMENEDKYKKTDTPRSSNV
ncbi:uncharacterized protein LOC128203394 [Mya arenaria]|uniref:uncharacterized protein LOC128203394 n=1 Tax=Mya arenaria TaxID=6604 RepID=UPI0022E41518|nr:uncharacterized protein LOC128203394 [Mya arenaria]